MNCNDSKPLRCAIEIPFSSDPSNCDAVPCGLFADIVCECCGLPLCSRCVEEFPCAHSVDGKHSAESELDLYRGRVQPDYRNAATYRKAAIAAAKEVHFKPAFLRILQGGAL